MTIEPDDAWGLDGARDSSAKGADVSREEVGVVVAKVDNVGVAVESKGDGDSGVVVAKVLWTLHLSISTRRCIPRLATK